MNRTSYRIHIFLYTSVLKKIWFIPLLHFLIDAFCSYYCLHRPLLVLICLNNVCDVESEYILEPHIYSNPSLVIGCHFFTRQVPNTIHTACTLQYHGMHLM